MLLLKEGDAVRADLYVMPFDGAPSDWERAVDLLISRYRKKATTKAPERSRLGEFAAGLLLSDILGISQDADLAIGDEGKPELASGSPHISISHDDGMAVLAVSDAVIGVDIEEIPEAYTKLTRDALRGVLSADTIAAIEASSNVPLAFAFAWTRVESVIKADGRGFSFNVRGGHLPEGWKCAQCVVEGHAISCAGHEEPELAVHAQDMAETISHLRSQRS